MIESNTKTTEISTLAPGLRRRIAPNPSVMTGPGTNTYIVGRGPYLIVDPGVDDEEHIEALLAACNGEVVAICLTHRHPDHVGGATWLAERTGAPVCAWPKEELAQYDQPVHIDQSLSEGETLQVGDMQVVVHHMPGHAADHVVLELPESRILLVGDTLMTDTTVVILPPDGDMGAYFATLDRLEALGATRMAPGHGRVLEDPAATIAEVRAHRRQREDQILGVLSPDDPHTLETIAEQIYPDLDGHLKMMAMVQVQAHLLHLLECNRAIREGEDWRAMA